MRLYFAYGSNMCPRQMAFRCPGARALGASQLHGWRFHVNTRGSASILPSEDSVVHGVLWRCRPEHFHILDRYEGVHWGNYRRRHVEVLTPYGTFDRAIVYAGTRVYAGQARVRYMATAVLPGARSFGLPEGYIEELHSWLPRHPIGEKKVPVRRKPRLLRFPR